MTSLLNHWLPRRCLYCAAPATDMALCEACAAALPWNAVACTGCALPLPNPTVEVCAECRARRPPFDAAFAAFRYEPPVQQALYALKYEARFEYARMLGRLMAQRLAARARVLPELLLPVPLHATRLRARGYNQALLLAREVATVLRLGIAATGAHRIRATADQIGQSAVDRRRNMHDAFAIDTTLDGRHIALLDDVMTTGATLAELARQCRRAGAAQIEVWVAARVA